MLNDLVNTYLLKYLNYLLVTFFGFPFFTLYNSLRSLQSIGTHYAVLLITFLLLSLSRPILQPYLLCFLHHDLPSVSLTLLLFIHPPCSPAPTDGKMKNNIPNNKDIGNSIMMDNRDYIDNDYASKKAKRLEEDTLSNNSLGSHRHRKLKSDSGSHRGSLENVDDGEEKRDASKEDLDDGMRLDGTTLTSTLSALCVYLLLLTIMSRPDFYLDIFICLFVFGGVGMFFSFLYFYFWFVFSP